MSPAPARLATDPVGPGCPHCFFPLLPLPPAGSVRCERCHRDFQAAPMHAMRPPSGRGAESLSGGASTPCAQHSGNAAVAECARCGAFMCGLCRVDVEGKGYCARCFDRLKQDNALGSIRTSYRNYNGMALSWALVSFLFWPAALVGGPLAIFMAIRGMRQSRRMEQETLGATGARWALGLGIVETLGVVIGVAFFIWGTS